MIREQLNIRPTTAIYGYFRKLSYDPWTAIAEFVDNSTQSYFDHKDELINSKDWTKLKVEIEYKESNGGCIIITDNAFGMNFDDFKRALILNSRPENISGRSEFGMGLKTAACWFGSYWTVTSSRLGENEEYRTVFDVNDFEKRQQADIDINRDSASREKHGTIIEISKLNKQLKGKTIAKIKDVLSSTYRRDIKSGEISLIYNGDELTYEEPEIYCDDDGIIYKKSVDFVVDHLGTEFPVKGYIAIREKGSVENSGFALIRRGRVIDPNYRPKELFGNQNSYAYQRIIGELDMDNWPVTQAKDKFDWKNDGLEEDFIEQLKPLMRDYKEVAEKRRKRKKSENEGTDVSEVDISLEKNSAKDPDLQPTLVPSPTNSSVSGNSSNHDATLKGIGDDVVESPHKSVDSTQNIFSYGGASREYVPRGTSVSESSELYVKPRAISEDNVSPKEWKTCCDFDGERYPLKIELVEDEGSQLIKLINSNDEEGQVTKVKINLLHPFFKERKDSRSSEAIISMAISMAVAEKESEYNSTEGQVSASYIREKISKVLEGDFFTRITPDNKE